MITEFKIATIEPLDTTGTYPVWGWLCPNGRIGVDKRGGGFALTHLPTGLRICVACTMPDAQRIATELESYVPAEGSWGVAPEIDDGIREVGRIVWREINNYRAF